MASYFFAVVQPSLSALWFGLAAGAWFAYFRLKQLRPTPFSVTLLALLGGWVSALGSLITFNLLESKGLARDWCAAQEGQWAVTWAAAAIEEGWKASVVLLTGVMGRRHFGRPKDMVFIGALSGVGFAAAETVLLCQQGLPLLDGIARAIASPVTHALFAAPVGSPGTELEFAL